jgi:2-polyprenyl-3-methyl-5-hydroxy-6-metoxy-1,4-benzoquinol methylase
LNCRFCNNILTFKFIDLVNSPPSNSFLSEEQLNEPEIFYPLKLYVCNKCFLVQIDEYKKSNEIFNNQYAYFSSYSKSWVEHARVYSEMVIKRFNINKESHVVEIASNDGYLLQHFLEKKIPCTGIEPTSNTAAVARDKGIHVIEDYFGVLLAKKLSEENKKADLIIGNNVLAHVPDVNDFVKGLKILLKENGIITMEFPHIMQLIEKNQFDTIYHEHFSYFSFITVKNIFESHELEIFDVEEIETHGGSLRIYAKHKLDISKDISKSIKELIDKEKSMEMNSINYYQNFQNKANKVKYNLLNFLIQQKLLGKKVAAYGAAAKGNTLLNYCGIKPDLVDFVVDLSPHKQGKYLPCSHIPIKKESFLKEERPDYVLILPWNIKEEIIQQLEYIKEWNGKFVIPIPELSIL